MSDDELAPDYTGSFRDSEYLHFINFKLGHTNRVLMQIRSALNIIAGVLVAAAAAVLMLWVLN